MSYNPWEIEDGDESERIIAAPHRNEWKQSGIDDELIDLNLQSVRGVAIFDLMFAAEQNQKRNNSGRLSSLSTWDKCLGAAGWLVYGVDPLTGETSCTPRFKQTGGNPIIEYWEKGFGDGTPKKKAAKYLNKSGIKNPPPIFLKVGELVAARVAGRLGLEPPADPSKFWLWVFENNIPITLTEGEKKAACLLSQGFAAISLPGIWMGTISHQAVDPLGRGVGDKTFTLHPALAPFDTSGREVSVLFDSREHTKKWETIELAAAKRLAATFTAVAPRIGIIPFESKQKGIDDYLVSGGDFRKIIFLNPQQKEDFDKKLKGAKNRAYFAAKSEEFAAVGYEPQLNLDTRYLSSDIIPDDERLVILKSPTNTGKTTIIKDWAKQQWDDNTLLICLTHRESLQGDISRNFSGLPQSFNPIYGGYDVGANNRSYAAKPRGAVICGDSLHDKSAAYFNLENFVVALEEQELDFVIFIDEIRQFVDHLLFSTTEVSKHRTEILKNLGWLLKNAKQIIGADADADKISIDCLSGLCGNDEPYLIQNNYRLGYDVTVLEGDERAPKALINAADIALSEGKKIWISVVGQKSNSKWGTKNLAARYEARGYKVMRVDSETTGNPDYPEFGCLENLSAAIEAMKPDVVIASPSVGTGVSVVLPGYFQEVFGIFYSIVQPNDAKQALGRVRDFNVPRTIWIGGGAIGKTYMGGDFEWKDILKSLDNKLATDIQAMNAADVELSEIDNDSRIGRNCLDTWAKIAARKNFYQRNFAAELIKNLEGEGCRVVIRPVDDDDLKRITEEQQHYSEGNVEADIEAILNAEVISEDEYLDLKRKRRKTTKEQHQESRFRLADLYGIELSAELLQREIGGHGFYSALRWHYALTKGVVFQPLSDGAAIAKAAPRSSFKPDIAAKCKSGAVAMLREMGLATFIERFSQEPFTVTNSFVIEFLNKVRATKNFKAITGINPRAYKNDVPLLKALLAKFDLELIGEGRETQGDRKKLYRVDCPNEEMKWDIFAAWEKKDEAAVEEKLELIGGKAEPETRIPVTNSNIVISNGVCDGVCDGIGDGKNYSPVATLERPAAPPPPSLPPVPPPPVPLYPRPDGGTDIYNLEYLFLKLWDDDNYSHFQDSFFLWNRGTVYAAAILEDDLFIGDAKIPHYEIETGGWVLIKDERLIEGCEVCTNFEGSAAAAVG